MISYLCWVWHWSFGDLPSHCPHPHLCVEPSVTVIKSLVHMLQPHDTMSLKEENTSCVKIAELEVYLRTCSLDRKAFPNFHLVLGVTRLSLVMVVWACKQFSHHISLSESELAASLSAGWLPIIHCSLVSGETASQSTPCFTVQAHVSSAQKCEEPQPGS